MELLLRSDCSQPGIRRRRRGTGFEYLDVEGDRITARETRARLAGLSIPRPGRSNHRCGRVSDVEELYVPNVRRRLERAVIRLIAG